MILVALEANIIVLVIYLINIRNNITEIFSLILLGTFAKNHRFDSAQISSLSTLTGFKNPS